MEHIIKKLNLNKNDVFERSRIRMVDETIISRGVTNEKVIKAMKTIPRHVFVDDALKSQAYTDFPLPIGEQQTISQPYIVAVMTEALELKGFEKVLEIGTGCGYQTAILGLLCDKVFSIERIKNLSIKARKVLDELGFLNINLITSDGTLGWQSEAPYDAIIVTAGAIDIPKAYIDQLKDGGHLVIPMGESEATQYLYKIKKIGNGIEKENLGPCRFVKLIGKNGWDRVE